MSQSKIDKAREVAEGIVSTHAGIKFALPKDRERLAERIAEAIRKVEFDFELYRGAWLRALGNKVFRKSHEVDALAETTRWHRARSERVELLAAETTHAELIREYGPAVTPSGQVVGRLQA
jgi:hypothetical protein